MPRPNPEVLEILEALLVEARAGRITDLYALWRDEAGDYDSDYWTDDLPDLLFELSTEILKERAAGVEPARN